MNRANEALFHDGTRQFCEYDKNNNKYKFILRTDKDQAGEVFIVINDIPMPMSVVEIHDCFKYYGIEIELNEKVSYYFKVNDIFYSAIGATDNYIDGWNFNLTPGFTTPDWAKGAVMYQIMVDRFYDGDKSNNVCTNEYAYINKGVSYIDDWYQNPAADDTREFYGGDLQGVIDKLDYLEKLGVEVIYFNPLFVSPSNHKYDTQDYDYIDPHFGKIVTDGGAPLVGDDIDNLHASKYQIRTTYKENLEASNKLFIELVEKAHEKGIKVIIDGVFNHCGSFNKWLDKEKIYTGNSDYAVGAYESKESPYNSYFKFTKDQWPNNNQFEGWWGFDTLPKLNYEGSEDLCQYIIDIGRKWVSPPYNVDGWRLDVAADLGHSGEFNHQFWKRFRTAVKEANPNAIILAEHYGDASSWLQGDQWDTVMNYDGFMDPVTWFLTGVDKHSDNSNPGMKGDAGTFNRTMQYQMNRMQCQSLQVAMNELSNHDHSRFMTRTNRMVGRIATAGARAASENIDKGIFKQGVIMQMTLPGAPTLYYGDEAGVCGWTDPDNRRTYPWGKEDLLLIEFYREAISIHKQNQVFKTGSYIPLCEAKDLLAYGRFDNEKAAVIAINTSGEDVEINIPSWKLAVEDGKEFVRQIETNEEFYNCARLKVAQSEGEIKFAIKKNSSVVYICKK